MTWVLTFGICTDTFPTVFLWGIDQSSNKQQNTWICFLFGDLRIRPWEIITVKKHHLHEYFERSTSSGPLVSMKKTVFFNDVQACYIHLFTSLLLGTSEYFWNLFSKQFQTFFQQIQSIFSLATWCGYFDQTRCCKIFFKGIPHLGHPMHRNWRSFLTPW